MDSDQSSSWDFELCIIKYEDVFAKTRACFLIKVIIRCCRLSDIQKGTLIKPGYISRSRQYFVVDLCEIMRPFSLNCFMDAKFCFKKTKIDRKLLHFLSILASVSNPRTKEIVEYWIKYGYEPASNCVPCGDADHFEHRQKINDSHGEFMNS